MCSSGLFSGANSSPSSVLRSSDQLYEVVSLACELLPPLPDSTLPAPASELFSVPRAGMAHVLLMTLATSIPCHNVHPSSHLYSLPTFQHPSCMQALLAGCMCTPMFFIQAPVPILIWPP